MNIDPSERPRRYSEDDYPEQQLSGLIIAAGYEVHRQFGSGFLELVYRRALVVELVYRAVSVRREVPFALMHRGVNVGDYRADIIANDRIIVEVKAGPRPDPFAAAQLLNYLSASGLEIGLVLHFGPELHIKRVVHTATGITTASNTHGKPP